MPRKVFVSGEILTAADVNTNLMDQAVMVFAGTAARGSAIPTPSEGMVTFRTDDDILEFWSGSAWVGASGAIPVDYFLAGGGAGGGGASGSNDSAGGGGASGFVQGTTWVARGSAIALRVGLGGAGGVGANRGASGGRSLFGDIFSGGAGGGGRAAGALTGGVDGVGGLSAGGSSRYSALVGLTVASEYGNNGGAGRDADRSSGGGGGAGGAGVTPTGTAGGNGGAGSTPTIGSTAVCGGGGGGARDAAGGTGQAGGGNGGNGSAAAQNGTDATANSGSGGGGAARAANGGAGGSGLVLLRIPTRFTVTFSNVTGKASAVSGSNTIYTITVAGAGETVTIG
jgi:hypothetical protein